MYALTIINEPITGSNRKTTMNEQLKQQVRDLALANGFKLKPQPTGADDLNPYVYDFAAALLAGLTPLPLRTAVIHALAGIDRTGTECDDGWWESSVGADFGRKKLVEVLAVLSAAVPPSLMQVAEAVRDACNEGLDEDLRADVDLASIIAELDGWQATNGTVLVGGAVLRIDSRPDGHCDRVALQDVKSSELIRVLWEIPARLRNLPVRTDAALKDAVLQAALDFVAELTGMTPPPIEVAPPEVFAPFRAFAERVASLLPAMKDERAPSAGVEALQAQNAELLAALTDLLTDSTERDPIKWHEAKRNARAAIAKAKGGQA